MTSSIVKQCTMNVTSKTPEPWSKRFEEAVRGYQYTQEEVVAQRSDKVIPSINEYIEMRREMHGTSITLGIAELLEVFQYPELTGAEAEKISALKRSALDIISWSMVKYILVFCAYIWLTLCYRMLHPTNLTNLEGKLTISSQY